MTKIDMTAARKAMIDSQLRTSGVNEPFVLARMAAVAREDFVPEGAKPIAYMDRAVDFKVNKPWYKIRSRHALDSESGGINGEPTKAVLAEGEAARDEIVRILSEKVSAIIKAETEG